MSARGPQRLLRGFGRAQRGTVAIIFAAIVVPVIGITAAAIDYQRAGKVRGTLQAAASAAAQAASRHLLDDRKVIERQVAAMLAANLPPHLVGLPHRLTLPNDRSFVEVSLETTVPTTLMGMLGLHELAVEATGRARPAAPEAPAVAATEMDRQGSVERSPGAGRSALPTSLPSLPSVNDQQSLREAATEIARKLEQELRSGNITLPPEAAAELQRAMRQLERGNR
ncbi:MAG: TadE/TadG family type IV pilus assembly protein [Hyphomicrobiaceae bacterium]